MGWKPLRTPSGKLSDSAPCRHPRCTRAVHFRNQGRGRLKEFCSDACRVVYLRDRMFLLESLEEVQRALDANPSHNERVALKAEARFLKWHLSHYGGLPPVAKNGDGAQNAETEEPSTPSTPLDDEGSRAEEVSTLIEPESEDLSRSVTPRPSVRKVMALIAEADPTTRAWLARHPEFPREAMRVLSKDPDVRVRRSLAERTDLPYHIHMRLRRDRAASVKATLLATALR